MREIMEYILLFIIEHALTIFIIMTILLFLIIALLKKYDVLEDLKSSILVTIEEFTEDHPWWTAVLCAGVLAGIFGFIFN